MVKQDFERIETPDEEARPFLPSSSYVKLIGLQLAGMTYAFFDTAQKVAHPDMPSPLSPTQLTLLLAAASAGIIAYDRRQENDSDVIEVTITDDMQPE